MVAGPGELVAVAVRMRGNARTKAQRQQRCHQQADSVAETRTRSLSMEDRSHLPATRHVNVCQQWMALNVHDRARTLYAQKRQVRPSANDS